MERLCLCLMLSDVNANRCCRISAAAVSSWEFAFRKCTTFFQQSVRYLQRVEGLHFLIALLSLAAFTTWMMLETVLWVCRLSTTACLETLSATKARASKKTISNMLPIASDIKQTQTLSSANNSILSLTKNSALQASMLHIAQMSVPPVELVPVSVFEQPTNWVCYKAIK